MPPELRDEVADWLVRVRADLLAAETLLVVPRPVPGVACFLCQQAAEKALKAFLAWRQTAFRKTHSLEYLLDLCTPLDGSFDRLRTIGRALTPYAWEFRYPGMAPEPPLETAHEGLRFAREVVRHVLDHLPAELRPEWFA